MSNMNIGKTSSLLEILISKAKNWQYEIVIFFALMMELIRKMPYPDLLYPYYSMPYLISYKMGFISRAFIGTIASLISGDFISKEFVWLFILCGYMMLCFCISCLLGEIIKTSDSKTKSFAIGLTMLYLINPFSPAYYLEITDIVLGTSGHFGQVEMYQFLFTLLVIVLLKTKKLYKLQWIIPILCFSIIATHLIGIFSFIPVIVIMLMHNMYVNNNSKSSKRLLISSSVVIFLSSIYFVLSSRFALLYTNVHDMLEHLPKTNLSITKLELEPEFFMSIHEHFVLNSSLYSALISRFIIVFIATLPLIAMLVFFWARVIQTEKNKNLKTLFFLSATFIPTCLIPIFVLTCDWGRWIFLIFTSQFILIFYYFYSKENSIILVVSEVINIVKKYLFVFIIIFIYLFVLGKCYVVLSYPLLTKIKSIIAIFMTLDFSWLHSV